MEWSFNYTISRFCCIYLILQYGYGGGIGMLVAEYLIKNTLYNVESGEQRIAFIAGEMEFLMEEERSRKYESNHSFSWFLSPYINVDVDGFYCYLCPSYFLSFLCWERRLSNWLKQIYIFD